MSVFVIAEIGINHNGDLDIAKRLIDGAVFSGADAVKFQKRTVEAVYSKEELDKPRESPWGKTNRAQKYGLEFIEEQYNEIDRFCKEKKIKWFASAWDIDSQYFLRKYDTEFNKVPSAMLTHKDLLEAVADEKKPTFISTGMSTMVEIDKAVEIFRRKKCSFELLHCNSTYPMPDHEANLKMIPVLCQHFKCNVGYSSHDVGLITACAAIALGATSIEKHITLDRAMYGSDQAASVEIMGFYRLVDYIRTIEKALGDGIKKVSIQEEGIKRKLRKVNTLV